MKKKSMFSKDIMKDSLVQSLNKLTPRVQIKNPVMFVVYIGAIFVTVLYFLGFAGMREEADASMRERSGREEMLARSVSSFSVTSARFRETRLFRYFSAAE